jgi:phosphopantothenoylcysteine decarboxylase
MNTFMYEHPLTNEHLRIVENIIGYQVVGPMGKTLACGDIGQHVIPLGLDRSSHSYNTGIGAMTEWKDIVKIVVDRFQLTKENEA